jgi:hypothetical protein
MITHLPSAPTRGGWLIAFAFLVLSAIPIAGGALRLSELGRGADVTPENARFFAALVPAGVA